MEESCLFSISIDNVSELHENLSPMSLPICTYGNPILRQKAVEVMMVNDDVRALVKAMFETMYEEQGVGLAAEQVGRTERVFIIDISAEGDVGRGRTAG